MGMATLLTVPNHPCVHGGAVGSVLCRQSLSCCPLARCNPRTSAPARRSLTAFSRRCCRAHRTSLIASRWEVTHPHQHPTLAAQHAATEPNARRRRCRCRCTCSPSLHPQARRTAAPANAFVLPAAAHRRASVLQGLPNARPNDPRNAVTATHVPPTCLPPSPPPTLPLPTPSSPRTLLRSRPCRPWAPARLLGASCPPRSCGARSRRPRPRQRAGWGPSRGRRWRTPTGGGRCLRSTRRRGSSCCRSTPGRRWRTYTRGAGASEGSE